MTGSGKEKIIEALETLMETKSFDRIRTKEIVELAGVNKTTFYYYFDSKEDIINSKIEEICEKLDHFRQIWPHFQSMESAEEKEKALFAKEERRMTQEWFQILYDERKHVAVIDRSKFCARFYEKIVEIYARFPRDIGTIDFSTGSAITLNNMRCQYLYDAAVAFVMSHLRTWIHRNFEESPEELTRILLEDYKIVRNLNMQEHG